MANTNLTTIVDSYGCVSNYQEMKAFFANSTNSRGIQDAINKYGTPIANRPSTNSGFGLFKKNWGWTDYCDWQNIEKFYQYAKLSVQFPILTNPQIDCSKVDSAILALNSQLANVDSATKDANIKIALTEALNDKIAEYQSFNVVNDCENLVKNQLYISTTGATSKTAIYIFGGAAVLIGLFYAIAVYKKNN